MVGPSPAQTFGDRGSFYGPGRQGHGCARLGLVRGHPAHAPDEICGPHLKSEVVEGGPAPGRVLRFRIMRPGYEPRSDMAGVHCSRCNSLIHTDANCPSLPPWCTICGTDFKPAGPDAQPEPARAGPAPPAAAPRPRVATPPARRAPPAPPSRPRPRAPLPAGAPAEVAALGNPEQAHAPDEREARRNRRFLRGLAAAVGGMVLALAGLLWWAADHPAPNLPPPDVALGVALAFAVLGLLSTATS